MVMNAGLFAHCILAYQVPLSRFAFIVIRSKQTASGDPLADSMCASIRVCHDRPKGTEQGASHGITKGYAGTTVVGQLGLLRDPQRG